MKKIGCNYIFLTISRPGALEWEFERISGESSTDNSDMKINQQKMGVLALNYCES